MATVCGLQCGCLSSENIISARIVNGFIFAFFPPTGHWHPLTEELLSLLQATRLPQEPIPAHWRTQATVHKATAEMLVCVM